MGADIYLGRVGDYGYVAFRDSYGGAITLNALRLSYWRDLSPRLDRNGRFPLELNEWLLGELRERMAEYLDSPRAEGYAREYLDSAEMPEANPEGMIGVWRGHIGQLVRLIEESSKRGVPLVMSL